MFFFPLQRRKQIFLIFEPDVNAPFAGGTNEMSCCCAQTNVNAPT